MEFSLFNTIPIALQLGSTRVAMVDFGDVNIWPPNRVVWDTEIFSNSAHTSQRHSGIVGGISMYLGTRAPAPLADEAGILQFFTNQIVNSSWIPTFIQFQTGTAVHEIDIPLFIQQGGTFGNGGLLHYLSAITELSFSTGISQRTSVSRALATWLTTNTPDNTITITIEYIIT